MKQQKQQRDDWFALARVYETIRQHDSTIDLTRLDYSDGITKVGYRKCNTAL